MEFRRYLEQVDGAYGSLKGEALESKLLKLLEDCRAEYGPNSVNIAAMLNELGAYYRGRGALEDSERYFTEALEIIRGTGAGGGGDWATTVNNLAGTHRMMGKFEQAEREFMECMAIYEKTLGKDHILYAGALNNLSLVDIGRGNLSRAAELQSEAAEVLVKNPGHRDELATSMCNLGALYQRLGRTEEARERFESAIKMYREELGTATPHYHAALNGMGAACYTAGGFDEAVGWFRLAAEAIEELYGKEHPEYKAVERHMEMALEAQMRGKGEAL